MLSDHFQSMKWKKIPKTQSPSPAHRDVFPTTPTVKTSNNVTRQRPKSEWDIRVDRPLVHDWYCLFVDDYLAGECCNKTTLSPAIAPRASFGVSSNSRPGGQVLWDLSRFIVFVDGSKCVGGWIQTYGRFLWCLGANFWV